MAYRFWDMDHTVIDNDCDVSWKRFLVERGIARADALDTARRFWDAYARDELDETEFLEFQLAEIAQLTESEARELSVEHFERLVAPTVYPQAKQMLESQIANGDEVYLLTATNRMIAAPVADALRLHGLIATELEMQGGRYTGKIAGVYCCGDGKRERLEAFLNERGAGLSEVSYYGDSVSDIAVLRYVGDPWAVNPMPGLREEAKSRGWNILDFARG